VEWSVVTAHARRGCVHTRTFQGKKEVALETSITIEF
jgi:hypothetical protein